jgi:hypothetical protein
MKKSILTLLTIFVSLNLFSQLAKVQTLKNDPFGIINKVIEYAINNRNSFQGACKVGYMKGDSYFDFPRFTRQYPNVIVSYSALGRSAREGGVLRNIRFKNGGNFNTKIIIADWQNFDKNSGSGLFELSVLDESNPNKFYLGITGYNWSYYLNIELNDNNFQEVINLLTVSGNPKNFLKEKQEKIEREILIKKEEEGKRKIEEDEKLRKLFIKDSIKKQEEHRLSELKIIEELNKKKVRDSIIKTLVIGSLFEDGIVINFQNNKTQAILLSTDEFLISKRELIDALYELKQDGNDWHKWQIPTYGNMNFVAKLLKTDKSFKKIFFDTKPKFENLLRDNFYWSNSMYVQLFGIGTFNIIANNDLPIDAVSNGDKALLRYIRISDLN